MSGSMIVCMPSARVWIDGWSADICTCYMHGTAPMHLRAILIYSFVCTDTLFRLTLLETISVETHPEYTLKRIYIRPHQCFHVRIIWHLIWTPPGGQKFRYNHQPCFSNWKTIRALLRKHAARRRGGDKKKNILEYTFPPISISRPIPRSPHIYYRRNLAHTFARSANSCNHTHIPCHTSMPAYNDTLCAKILWALAASKGATHWMSAANTLSLSTNTQCENDTPRGWNSWSMARVIIELDTSWGHHNVMFCTSSVAMALEVRAMASAAFPPRGWDLDAASFFGVAAATALNNYHALGSALKSAFGFCLASNPHPWSPPHPWPPPHPRHRSPPSHPTPPSPSTF